MHRKFLSMLCCPKTGESLRLEGAKEEANGFVTEGTLMTDSGNRYPIARGIPRFVEAERYAGSFGFEWNRWPRLQFESENVGRPMAGWTTRMWERITEATEEEIRGKHVVEFGCGPGRFLDVVRRKGGMAIGIDLSLAVEAARTNFGEEENVLIVQGDLANAPFRKGAFDGGYSIGVLHHTPDPLKGLLGLVESVREGGWVACCVYPKGELYDFRSTARFRKWHHRVKGRFGYRPAMAYSHFSAYVLSPFFRAGRKVPGLRGLCGWLERNWLVVVPLPDRRWSVLDTFDAITPAMASTHTREEVESWMKAAGCLHIRHTDWGSTSVRGVRPRVNAFQEGMVQRG
jgi:SAM-dependent methyltransferase